MPQWENYYADGKSQMVTREKERCVHLSVALSFFFSVKFQVFFIFTIAVLFFISILTCCFNDKRQEKWKNTKVRRAIYAKSYKIFVHLDISLGDYKVYFIVRQLS